MSVIQTYIEELSYLSDNFHEFVAKAIQEKESFIVGLIKNRLYQKGLDGDLKRIGDYSIGTAELKKNEGKRSSHITLRDEGDFYQGMYARYSNGLLETNSTDGKTPSLVNIYGEAILKLSEQEQELIIDRIIDQAVANYTKELANIISMDGESAFFSAQ